MTACTLVLLSAAGAVPLPQNVLLEFSATWCGPCRQMKPVVERLIRQGYPVRQIDVDRNPQLARQYGVTSIPAFLLVINGRVVSRTVGYTAENRLKQMLAQIPRQAVSPPPSASQRRNVFPPKPGPRAKVAVAQSGREQPGPMHSGDTERPQRRFQLPLAADNDNGHSFGGSGEGPVSSPQAGAVIRANLDAARTRLHSHPAEVSPTQNENTEAGGRVSTTISPLAASARIRIRDGEGSNFGSGTVIDSRPGSAVILTCGHIFRNLSAAAVIEVDLFHEQTVRKYTGKLLAYDLKADVGLIALRPQSVLPFVRPAMRKYVLRKGDSLVAIGCGGGRTPLQMAVRVTALNRYLGPDNIECTGVPQQGRSGGGLFNRQGQLVGVCFAADPPRGRGLYAGLQPIYDLLQKAGVHLRAPEPFALADDTKKNATGNASPAQTGTQHGPPMTAGGRNESRNEPPAFPADTAAGSAPAGPFNIEIDRNQLSQMQQAAERLRKTRVGSSRTGNGDSATQPTPANGKDSRAADVAASLNRIDAVFGAGGEAEVICIIRPLDQPRSASQVVVIHRASGKFVKYLRNELNQQPRPTSRFVPAKHSANRAVPLARETSSRRFLSGKLPRPSSTGLVNVLRQAAMEESRPVRQWEAGRYRRSAASRR